MYIGDGDACCWTLHMITTNYEGPTTKSSYSFCLKNTTQEEKRAAFGRDWRTGSCTSLRLCIHRQTRLLFNTLNMLSTLFWDFTFSDTLAPLNIYLSHDTTCPWVCINSLHWKMYSKWNMLAYWKACKDHWDMKLLWHVQTCC